MMARYGHSFMTKPRFKTAKPRWASRLRWRVVEPKGVVKKVEKGRTRKLQAWSPWGTLGFDVSRPPKHVTYKETKYGVSLLGVVNAILPFFLLRFDAMEGIITKRRLERRYRHERVLREQFTGRPIGLRKRCRMWVKAWPKILFEGPPPGVWTPGPGSVREEASIVMHASPDSLPTSPLEWLDGYQTTRQKRGQKSA